MNKLYILLCFLLVTCKGGKYMGKLMKFIYVIVHFLSLFLVVMNVEGKPLFIHLSFFSFFSSYLNVLYPSNIIIFILLQHIFNVILTLNVKIKLSVCFPESQSVLDTNVIVFVLMLKKILGVQEQRELTNTMQ